MYSAHASSGIHRSHPIHNSGYQSQIRLIASWPFFVMGLSWWKIGNKEKLQTQCTFSLSINNHRKQLWFHFWHRVPGCCQWVANRQRVIGISFSRFSCKISRGLSTVLSTTATTGFSGVQPIRTEYLCTPEYILYHIIRTLARVISRRWWCRNTFLQSENRSLSRKQEVVPLLLDHHRRRERRRRSMSSSTTLGRGSYDIILRVHSVWHTWVYTNLVYQVVVYQFQVRTAYSHCIQKL